MIGWSHRRTPGTQQAPVDSLSFQAPALGSFTAARRTATALNFGARINPLDCLAVDLFMLDDAGPDEYEIAYGLSGSIPFNSNGLSRAEETRSSHHAAAPSFFGDTGMILMPNAITAPRHTATPVYHRIDDTFGVDPAAPGYHNNFSEWQNAGARFGIADRVELYAGYLWYTDHPFSAPPGDGPVDRFVVHAKAQALREPQNWCNLAIGVRNFGMTTTGPWEEGEHEPDGYIVATKTLCSSEDEEDPSYVRASLGLLLANEDGLLQEEYFPGSPGGPFSDYRDDSLFGGIEWRPCQWVTFMGELIEVGDDEGNFNFGARFHPVDELSVDMFMVKDAEAKEHEFGWGLGYQIDF
ncbi:MAG: hypothetical protein ACE5R4_16625 [Armatimonadota bacterium]